MQKNLDRGRPQPKQNMLIILFVHKKSGAISWNNVELGACVSGVEHLCQALKSSIMELFICSLKTLPWERVWSKIGYQFCATSSHPIFGLTSLMSNVLKTFQNVSFPTLFLTVLLWLQNLLTLHVLWVGSRSHFLNNARKHFKYLSASITTNSFGH